MYVQILLKFTKKEISNNYSIVKNGFRQQANIPDESFLNSIKLKLFTKKLQFIKIISKRNE